MQLVPNLHSTISGMMTLTGNRAGASKYLSRSFRMLFLANLWLHFACVFYGWCFESNRRKISTSSLVGRKFAGFFFSKKIRFLAWFTVSMYFLKIHENREPT